MSDRTDALIQELRAIVAEERRGERLLRLPEVAARSGLGTSTIYRGVEDGWFPRPRRAGVRVSGWLESELDAWLKSLPYTDASRD